MRLPLEICSRARARCSFFSKFSLVYLQVFRIIYCFDALRKVRTSTHLLLWKKRDVADDLNNKESNQEKQSSVT